MADYGTLLRERVTLKRGSIDRIFLQALRAEAAIEVNARSQTSNFE